MKDIDLVKKVRGYAEAAKGNGYKVLTVPLCDLFPLIEQLEAAQRERNSLLASQEHEDSCLIDALASRDEWRLRAVTAEAELKRRDAQEPIYQMRLLDGGEGEQEWLEVTKKEYSTPTTTKFGTWERRKLYAAAPAVVLPPELVAAIERLTHEAGHISSWYHIDEHSCKVNRRDLITLTDAVKALGCQPEKVVKLPVGWQSLYDHGSPVVVVKDEVKAALDAAGVKWEEAK